MDSDVAGRVGTVVKDIMVTGVIRVVTAGDGEGRTVTIPDACRARISARIMITPTAAAAMILNVPVRTVAEAGDPSAACVSGRADGSSGSP